jgi:hypothetical protein
MKKKIILISSLAFFLITCRNDKGPLPIAKAAGDCDTAYWYIGIIEPIIIANCNINAGCHGAGGSALSFYTTYAGVKTDVDNGTFKTRVFDKNQPVPMPKPPGSLSAAQLDRITCWLQHGAPQTGTGATTTCSTPISYAGTISPLITTNCTNPGCHGVGSTNGADFTSYSGLTVDVNNGTLNNRVVVLKNHPTFPTALPSVYINNIDCWIQQGAQNN